MLLNNEFSQTVHIKAAIVLFCSLEEKVGQGLRFGCVGAFVPLVLLSDLLFPIEVGQERLSNLYIRGVSLFADDWVTSENPQVLNHNATRVNDSVVVVICVKNIVVCWAKNFVAT